MRALLVFTLFLSLGASADEEGRFQWVLLATVTNQEKVDPPAYCDVVLCMDAYFDVSIQVDRTLGARIEPTPTVLIGADHYGDDPFLSGRNYRYLIYAHNFRDVPRAGVSLRVLETNDGRLAVPVVFLLDWWETSGCDAFVHDLEFVEPKEWLSWYIGGPEEEQENAAEISQLLKYAVRDNDSMIFTKGVLIDDLAVGAKALRVGCVTDLTANKSLQQPSGSLSRRLQPQSARQALAAADFKR